MQSLKAHNDRALDAEVTCDECTARMIYDLEGETRERDSFARQFGRPVKCPECGFTGRKLQKL